MTALAVVLSALLALACVLFAARAFLRPGSDELELLSEDAAATLALVEERDRLLSALQELEFDHRAGTVSDEDYRAQVGPLRREIAAVLAGLDTGAQPAPGAVEAAVVADAEGDGSPGSERA